MSQFEDFVKKSKKDVENLNKSIIKISTLLENDMPDEAISESFEYERLAERTVNNARLLPVASGVTYAVEKVKGNIVDLNNVDIKYLEKGWFYVKMPFLLPKKEKGNPTYIRTTINAALEDFFKDKKKILFDDCVIVFKHNYSEDTKKYRDHDNIELNVVVDALALYAMVDDAPMRCKHFYCSSKENSDSTEVFVLPYSDFINFLSNLKLNT